MDSLDNDIQLMLRCQKGEDECFEVLINRHKQKIFNFAYRFMGNYQEAEDIAQNTFIKAYYAKENYSPKAKLTTWLFTICKNTCLKELRKKTPAVFSLDNTLISDGDTIELQTADPKALTPSELVLKKEKAYIVKKAIDKLPENQKIAIILYRYEGLSYEEISQILKCSLKAIKSLLHRAKLNLKQELTYYFKITEKGAEL